MAFVRSSFIGLLSQNHQLKKKMTFLSHSISLAAVPWLLSSSASRNSADCAFEFGRRHASPRPQLRFARRERLVVAAASGGKGALGEGRDGSLVRDLRVPDAWLIPSNAEQESKWLRVTLHKWLDDEYCPEPTNVDISKVAARSFYESLLVQQSDLGVILLKMAKDLETISYQESFHGAFSSANAAIYLITSRINFTEGK